jgi:hypothetical protein
MFVPSLPVDGSSPVLELEIDGSHEAPHNSQQEAADAKALFLRLRKADKQRRNHRRNSNANTEYQPQYSVVRPVEDMDTPAEPQIRVCVTAVLRCQRGVVLQHTVFKFLGQALEPCVARMLAPDAPARAVQVVQERVDGHLDLGAQVVVPPLVELLLRREFVGFLVDSSAVVCELVDRELCLLLAVVVGVW